MLIDCLVAHSNHSTLSLCYTASTHINQICVGRFPVSFSVYVIYYVIVKFFVCVCSCLSKLGTITNLGEEGIRGTLEEF